MNAVSGAGGTTALTTRNPKLAEILAKAEAINARKATYGEPEDDRYFVHDVLGKTLDEAKKEQRKYAKLFHQDMLAQIGANPNDQEICKTAFTRVMVCMKQATTEGGVPMPGSLQLAKAGANFAGAFVAVAGYADRGIRAAREAWQRKVDDGTVEAVATTAKDIFEVGCHIARRGWAEAVALSKPPSQNRKSAKKD